MEDTDELWRAFLVSGDREIRNRLVERFAPLVRRVVGRFAIAGGAGAEAEDLLSLGTIGLIEAVERFDPSRGIRFEAYAIARIRGAVLDGLRQLDPAPVSWRRRARLLGRAYEELEGRLGRDPTEEEVAEYLGIERAELHRWLDEIGRISVLSLEEVLFDDVTRLDRVEDGEAEDPSGLAERRERIQRLAAALGRLSERERQVVALFYNDGLTVSEISQVLGLSPSRISQLHRRAVLRLRGLLSRHKAFFKEA